MLLDNSLNLDIAVSLTTSGSSTNYIDTIGASGGATQISGVNTIQGGGDAYEQLWWEILVTTTVTSSGSATVDFQLWTAPTVALIWTTGNAGSLPVVSSTLSTYKLGGSGAVPKAALISSAGTPGTGYTYKTRLAQGVQRYIAGYYLVSGAASLSAGAWSSVLTFDVDINLT